MRFANMMDSNYSLYVIQDMLWQTENASVFSTRIFAIRAKLARSPISEVFAVGNRSDGSSRWDRKRSSDSAPRFRPCRVKFPRFAFSICVLPAFPSYYGGSRKRRCSFMSSRVYLRHPPGYKQSPFRNRRSVSPTIVGRDARQPT